MGAVCNKSNTKKIKVKSKPFQNTPQNDNQETTNQPKKVDIKILNEKVGDEFQKVIEESDQQQFEKKQNQWKQIECKIQSFQNEYVFIQLLNNDAIALDDQQQQITSTYEQQVKMKNSQTSNSESIKRIADSLEGEFKFRDKKILEAYICKQQDYGLFSKSLMSGSLAKYRWSFWIASVYDNSIYEPELYQKLKLKEVSSKVECDIKKDLHRTFSTHGHFQDTLGQQQLFSILKALSIIYDDIGYVQGMNYVVAFCLIVNGGNEEETFWFLNFINKNPKFQWWELYRDRFPYAQFLLSIFHKNFSLNLPELYNKFLDEGFIDQQYVWQWILTQFIYAFPVDYVIQFWDFMLGSDTSSLIKLSIGILQDVGYELQNQDLQGISLFFSNFIQENRCLDIAAIIEYSQKLELDLTDNEKQYLKAPDKRLFI